LVIEEIGFIEDDELLKNSIMPSVNPTQQLEEQKAKMLNELETMRQGYLDNLSTNLNFV
jgi:hypothetical protein